MTGIQSTAAPAAIGPYAQVRVVNNLLFVSGQLPIDPVTGKLVDGAVDAQLRQCLANIGAIAEAAGRDMKSVVKTTLLMADLSQFAAVNAEYSKFFSEPYPARTTFQVAALPLGALIEVESIIQL